MLQNSDYWPRCLEFLTSGGQLVEADRLWILLSPSKNVKKQTNLWAHRKCLPRIIWESRHGRHILNRQYAVPTWQAILFTSHLRIATCAKLISSWTPQGQNALLMKCWLPFCPISDNTMAKDNALCIITSAFSATNLSH